MKQKIIIENNKLKTINNENITIKDNQIILKKDKDYIIELKNCNNINLNIIINEEVSSKLFIISKNNKIIINNNITLNKKSNLKVFKFYDNNNTKEETIISLNGEYSKYYQGFSSISKKEEEYHIIVNHNQNNVYSDIRNKCIALENSLINIKIDSILEKGNIDCTMDQTSRILTLGNAKAKIIPNMFIEENNVEARHSSIIGSFDEEELFYLTSKGIEREEAILLLIKGFLFSNLNVDLEEREYIMNSILELRR